MDRRNVKPGLFKGIGYDQSSSTLEIEFNNGVVWQYHDVPASAWAAYDKAESPNMFFHNTIHNRFRETQVL